MPIASSKFIALLYAGAPGLSLRDTVHCIKHLYRLHQGAFKAATINESTIKASKAR